MRTRLLSWMLLPAISVPLTAVPTFAAEPHTRLLPRSFPREVGGISFGDSLKQVQRKCKGRQLLKPTGEGTICLKRAPAGEHLVIWYGGLNPDPEVPADPSVPALPDSGSVYEFEYKCRMTACLRLVDEMRVIQAKLSDGSAAGAPIENVIQWPNQPQKWLAWYGTGAIEVDLELRKVRVILGYALLRGTQPRYLPVTPEMEEEINAETKRERGK